MKTCIYMNLLSVEYNKNLVSDYVPNKDIKCNDCDWCSEWEKANNYLVNQKTFNTELESQNKIDLGLIQVYAEEKGTASTLKLLEKATNNKDKNEIIFYYEILIRWVRNLYRLYLVENGVAKAKDFNFIYTKQFMMLAKDVL